VGFLLVRNLKLRQKKKQLKNRGAGRNGGLLGGCAKVYAAAPLEVLFFSLAYQPI